MLYLYLKWLVNPYVGTPKLMGGRHDSGNHFLEMEVNMELLILRKLLQSITPEEQKAVRILWHACVYLNQKES